jgi:hypothetical protein
MLGAPFDHATTRFALTGNHRAVAARLPPTMFPRKTHGVCELPPGQGRRPPIRITHRHAASTCESCHVSAWAGARYDHAQTRSLTGGHVSQTCLACHSDRVYAGKPALCVSCHQRNYDLAAAGSPATQFSDGL